MLSRRTSFLRQRARLHATSDPFSKESGAQVFFKGGNVRVGELDTEIRREF
jgi:hypothetical protein